jgi:hypothetical protein
MMRRGLKETISLSVALLIIMAMTCCTSTPPDVEAALSRARDIMNAAPDSALRILDSIPPQSIARSRKADRATMALLTTMARHKCYIDETSDSLIVTAVDYYADHSPKSHDMMLAHYYHGVILSNARNYAPAIISLMKTEKLAEALEDYLFLGRSRFAICDIYRDVYSFNEEERYARLALEAFEKSEDTLSVTFAKERLIVGLSNTKHYTESNLLAHKLLEKSIENKDTQLICKSLEHIGFNYHNLNKHKEAAEAFMRLKNIGPNQMNNKLYYFLTTELWNSGNHSEAKSLIDSLNHLTEYEAIFHPDILYKLGMFEDAYKHQKRAFNDADSAIAQIIRQNVSTAVSKHYDEEIASEKAQSQRLFTNFIYVILLLFIIILFITYRYKVIKRERHQKEEKIIDLAQELNALNLELTRTSEDLLSTSHQLNRLNEHESNLSAGLSRLENDRLNAVTLLCEIYNTSEADKTTQTQSVKEAQIFINRISSDPNLTSDLEKKIDREHDNLMQRFRAQMPELNENEYIIFIGGVLHISSHAMQHIWGIKRNSFYSIRRRLRDKIIAADTRDKEIFLKCLR